MKIVHNVKITVFAKNSDLEEVENTLIALLPDSTKKDIIDKKLGVVEEVMKGETNIFVRKLTISKNRQCNEFLTKLFSNLKSDTFSDCLDERIDESCKCYLRLDKQKLLKGEYALTDSGDCFHIKMTIAAYPSKRENAEKLIKKLI